MQTPLQCAFISTLAKPGPLYVLQIVIDRLYGFSIIIDLLGRDRQQPAEETVRLASSQAANKLWPSVSLRILETAEHRIKVCCTPWTS